MSGVSIIPLLFVVGIVVATIALGLYATRLSRTTSDFYVAGRGVNAFWNSSAISGEYLSAASFMGIAGMVMKFGYDVLWYAVGYAAGYVFLLLFIAGPLRRFGAYTIPDFAEGRFDSRNMRKVAVVFALCISFFYMMPQMKGAGITLAQLLGSPYWVGVAVVGVVITANVILGGMKGVTFVQAFQYWVKQFAILVPIFVLMAVFGGYGSQVAEGGSPDTKPAVIEQDVTYTYPANSDLKFTSDGTVVVADTDADAKLTTYDASGKPAGKEAVVLTANEERTFSKGDKLTFADKAKVTLKAGMSTPNFPKSESWLKPFGAFTSKYAKTESEKKWIPLLYTYSLIVALLCGTAGLPHILVRFYTNPDGREAKKTTLMVICFLSLFYIFPAMWGAMGRNVMPALYANNTTDLVTIKLPLMLRSQLAGQIFSGVTSAGAFAAFMTTFSGLLVSVSGGFAHDIYGRILRHDKATDEERLKAFKIAAAGGGIVAIGLGLLVETFDINMLVGWAFAIGASSYFPLLLLGAWWSKLTKAGAVSGMLGGGAAAVGSVLYTMFVDKGIVAAPASGLVNTLLAQPAIWTVPLAVGLMVVVSLATRRMVPVDIDIKMLKLHAPETLGLRADYIKD